MRLTILAVCSPREEGAGEFEKVSVTASTRMCCCWNAMKGQDVVGGGRGVVEDVCCSVSSLELMVKLDVGYVRRT